MPTLSGVVRNAAGVLGALVVRAYLKDNGAFIAETTSDAVTGTFSLTVPTTFAHTVIALDQVADSSVVVMMHMNGVADAQVFKNEAAGGTLTVVGGAKTVTGQSVFNGSAGYFDGNGDYLLLTEPALGTGPFTVSYFFRLGQLAKSCFIFDCRPGADNANGFIFYPRSTNKLTFWSAGAIEGTTTLVANRWYHAELTRDASGTLRGFLDGTLEFSTTNASDFTATSWRVGMDYANSNNGGMFNVAEFCVRNICLHTASFPVPAAPYTHILAGSENALVYDGVVPV